MRLLGEAHDSLHRTRNAAELSAEAGKFAKSLGFQSFAYVLNVSTPSLRRERRILNDYSPTWVDKYISSDYFAIDPLIEHASRRSEPLIWDEHRSPKGKTEEFWEEARMHGLVDGVSFSMHNRPGVTAIFSLSRDQRLDLHGDALAAMIGRGQVFTSLLHEIFCSRELAQLSELSKVALTNREREVMRWIAEGKTTWEVARLMPITERTVVFHVKNVVKKLGAKNRTQAVVRALMLGLL